MPTRALQRVLVDGEGQALVCPRTGIPQDREFGGHHDRWFYPDEMSNDLQAVGVPEKFIPEALASAWEYTRVVIPHFTNWERYIAFCRIIVVAVIVEFEGSLVNVTTGDRILGYNLDELLGTIFRGTRYGGDMAREFRSFLLFTAHKSSNKRETSLFRRYADALTLSPKIWFRLRDCDALLRFTFAGALACNNFDNFWFEEDQLQMLAEIGDTMYDAVAFHKHRAEGEIHSTFAYVNETFRKEAYRLCREILWALDVFWANSPARLCIVNLMRSFGGPLHMMTRRYRFVEDGLMIGRPETDEVVAGTRKNHKLWYRVEARRDPEVHSASQEDEDHVFSQKERLFFPGLDEILQRNVRKCDLCKYPQLYGSEANGHFGGTTLCCGCRKDWNEYIQNLPARVVIAFPFLEKCITR